MKKNVAGQFIGAQMLNIADGLIFTGIVKVYITGDNGSQTLGSVGSGICANKGNGYYSYTPSQAESNFNHAAFTFTGTGAITATPQVYTGFPQSVDNGVKLSAAALESTSQDILAQVTGTGNRLVTIHVQDTLGDPIADVFVRIGTASDSTDPSGDEVFALDDGDYAPVLRKDFVTFTNPEALTVDGDGTHIFVGIIFAPDVPTQPDTCVVYGIVTDNGNAVVEGTKIFINTVDNSTFAGEAKIVKNQETESAADGTWQLELIRNSALAPNESYQVIMCDTSFKFETTITVPDKDSEKFSDIKGT